MSADTKVYKDSLNEIRQDLQRLQLRLQMTTEFVEKLSSDVSLAITSVDDALMELDD